MVNDLLIRSYLKRLRLPVIAQNYTRLSKEAAAHNQTFEDYLLALLEGEVVQRDENAQKLRLSRAHFPVIKLLDSFDFSAIPSLNKALVLELSRGGFVERRENAFGHRPGSSRLPPGEESPLLHRRRAYQRTSGGAGSTPER